MVQQRFTKDQIYDAVVEIADSTKRDGLLDELCGNDTQLKSDIQQRLNGQADSNNPLAQIEPDPHRYALGTKIGPYCLIEHLGKGGMGAVYLAKQTHPVERLVALKVIKSGMDSRDVLSRFEAERKALAMMEHPNIARILDAGSTEDGQPFFVMEYVEGTRLTDYCDEHRLSVNERLQLVMDVCSGVQHAHQKGIIHRDLKPSNIIVAEVDGKPVVKVIDFGLAKALKSKTRLHDQTNYTQMGQIVGTYRYMSPEQASLGEFDVDTRTDIYAMGVILYELLTGSTPLDSASVQNRAAIRILASILQQEPPRPSSRLRQSRDTLATITHQRNTDRVPSEAVVVARPRLDRNEGVRKGARQSLRVDVGTRGRHPPLFARRTHRGPSSDDQLPNPKIRSQAPGTGDRGQPVDRDPIGRNHWDLCGFGPCQPTGNRRTDCKRTSAEAIESVVQGQRNPGPYFPGHQYAFDPVGIRTFGSRAGRSFGRSR